MIKPCKRSMIFVTVAAAVIVSPKASQAADLSPVIARPLPSPLIWSGLYLGAQGGGFYFSDTAANTAIERVGPLSIGHHSIQNASYFVGGYAGYNYQWSSIVLGVEGDLSSVLGGRAVSPPIQTNDPAVFVTGASDPTLLATASARFGLAMGSFLLYAKAGGAWARVDYTGTAQTNLNAALGSETISKNRSGWIVGAGAEYAWTPNILSRLEYNYIDFNTESITFSQAGVNVFSAEFSSKAHVVKGGIALKFDWFGGL